jgi:methyl-accepting chemotaxis protein
VAAIQAIGGTIGRINAIAATIAASADQQSATMREIARNVQAAAHGTREVTENIGEVERGAMGTGAAADQVLAAARELAGHSGRLSDEIGTFLTRVRAA